MDPFFSWRKYDPFPAVLVLLVLLTALFFHAPVRLLDPLTGLPVDGVSVRIPLLRILFEPFLGPLLFFLRADGTLRLFIGLLIWVLGGTFLFAISRGVRLPFTAGNRRIRPGPASRSRHPGPASRSRQPGPASRSRQPGPASRSILRALRSWMMQVPLYLSIWLALLWLSLDLPLPSNSLENLRKDRVVINTHSHSQYSHGGLITREGLRKWHRHNGFDAFFITDHDDHSHTLEYIDFLDNREETGPLVLPGEEFTGSNDLVLLDPMPGFRTSGKTDREVIEATQGHGGLVIVAHWIWQRGNSISYFADLGVDGFEVVNQETDLYVQPDLFYSLVEACEKNGLLMLGAVDNHGYGATCSVWNLLEIPGWRGMGKEEQKEAVLAMLKEGQEKVRVVTYRDRPFRDPLPLILQTPWTLMWYFRSLEFPQVLSWIFWIVVFRFLYIYIKEQGFRGRKILRIAAAVSSIYLLASGIIMMVRSGDPGVDADTYWRYAIRLTAAGFCVLLYEGIRFTYNRLTN